MSDFAIDKRLVKKAVPISQSIIAVEESWKEQISQLKDKLLVLPYYGDYECRFKNNFIIITGWTGTLSLNKIYYHGVTYHIVDPLIKKDFKIMIVYTKKGKYQYVTTDPAWGFHYNGSGIAGVKLCLGDITFSNCNTWEKTKEACALIAKNLELINCHSIGSRYESSRKMSRIRSVILNASHEGFERLIEEGLLTRVF